MDTKKFEKQCPEWAKQKDNTNLQQNLCLSLSIRPESNSEWLDFMTKNCPESCGLCPKKEQTACNMVEIFGKLNGKQKLKLVSKGE